MFREPLHMFNSPIHHALIIVFVLMHGVNYDIACSLD